MTIQTFLNEAIRWAEEQADIQALALVGSHARGSAKETSDIDLVLLVDDPHCYLADASWVSRFGRPARQQAEDYGKLISLRVGYQNGPEVEFGLTTPDWAALPPDEGADRVLMDGVRLLFERKPVLSPALEGFSQAEDIFTGMMQLFQSYINPDKAASRKRWSKNADFISYGLNGANYNEIRRKFNPAIQALPRRGRLHLARLLVLTERTEPIDFATAILARSVKELGPADFAYLEEHTNHFHDWGHTDDFCINVLQPLLWKYPEQTLELARRWNRSENIWQRRASVVVFTRNVGASGQFTGPALELCENLSGDPEDLIQKGVGWTLKDLMRGDKDRVLEYVKELRRRGVPATITLYAIRDLKGAERQAVLDIHRL